jgi:hypothetical protein
MRYLVKPAPPMVHVTIRLVDSEFTEPEELEVCGL